MKVVKFLILIVLISTSIVARPSWCDKAISNVEKRICNNENLYNLEDEITQIYNILKNQVFDEKKKKLIKAQRKWIKSRNNNCKNKKDNCIKRYYINRIDILKDTLKSENYENSFVSFKNLDKITKYEKEIEDNIKKLQKKQVKWEIKTVVNQKHYQSINLLFQLQTKTITYSLKDSFLKIWDKKNKKLLKEFSNLNNIENFYVVSNNLFFWSDNNLYKITLDELKKYKLISNMRPIGDLIVYGDYLIIGLNTELHNKYNGVNLLLYNYKTLENSIYEVYSCPWTNCVYNFFLYKPVPNIVYIQVNEEWKKILRNENDRIVKLNSSIEKSVLSDAKVYKVSSEEYPYMYVLNKKYEIIQDYNNNPKQSHSIQAINETDNTCIIFNNKKIHCAVATGGSGAYDSEFTNAIYTTNKGKIIVSAFIGTTIGMGDEYFDKEGYEKSGYYFYIIEQDGTLLRKIKLKNMFPIQDKINKDKLKIYNDQNYIVSKDIIEVLDDNFKTINYLKDTISEDVELIEKKDNKIIVYYKGNIKQYFDLKDTKFIFTKYIFSTDSWINITPEGFFSGQGNFKEYIHFINSKYNIYTINQFYDHFFRPDLVQLKLSGDEEAYQKAINGMTYEEALKNPPPKVSILEVDDKSITKSNFDYTDVNISKEKIKFTFEIKEHDKGGIGLIRIYQEGKLIQTIGEGKDNRKVADVFNANKENKINMEVKKTQEKMRLASNDKENKRGKGSYIPASELLSPKSIDTITNNQEGKKTIEAILQSGDNQFCVEAFNKTNTVTSYRECITIHANIPKRKPKLYGLAIGINDFSTHREYANLTYSQKDAQDIKDAIEKQNSKLYKSIEIETLLGVKATQENILAKLKAIKEKASIDDTIIFYISTHGTANNNELYLIPQNAKDDYISFNNIFQAIQSIPSLKQIMIVDACQSGQASDIVSSIYDSRASVLAKSAGVHLLLATTKGTSAFESQEENIKNGVFTYQILTALKDKETDTNKDNVISVIELSNRLKAQANKIEKQYPIIRNVGGDVKLREAM